MLGAGLAAPARAATLVRYPYLQNLRRSRVSILWTALESSEGIVRFSTDRSFSSSVNARVRDFRPAETGLVFPFYQYHADLTGLRANTEYFYQVFVNGQNLTPGDELRFRTGDANPFTFLVFGDSGQGTPAQFQLAKRMIEENPAPALVLHAGDIAYGFGRFVEFQARYFDVYRDLMKRAPFFPCPGNHDYETRNAAPYLAVHAVPTEGVPQEDRGRYYSFDWANVHFVALDSNLPLADAVNGAGKMLEWLENDLRGARHFWRIVYFHHSPFASGLHEDDPVSRMARERIVPVLERYGVQLVFCGHEHSYQRSQFLRNGAAVGADDGTLYITTGGGGAGLYPVFSQTKCCGPIVAFGESAHHYVRGEVDGSRITLRAIRVDGREIDRITLAPVRRTSVHAVVNAASFTPSLAPGSLVSVFGRNLALNENFVSQLPLPLELSGASVTLDGERLPLLYVSPTQINSRLPFKLSGQATLRVSTVIGSVEATLTISDAAPGIFLVPTEFGRLPAVLHTNYQLVSPQSPAETGEWLSVFLTGMGRVDGEIATGQPAPSSPLLRVSGPVAVRLDVATVLPSFAGLAPGFVGLYQVNFLVPQLPSGTYRLRILVGGASSNVVRIPVRSAEL